MEVEPDSSISFYPAVSMASPEKSTSKNGSTAMFVSFDSSSDEKSKTLWYFCVLRTCINPTFFAHCLHEYAYKEYRILATNFASEPASALSMKPTARSSARCPCAISLNVYDWCLKSAFPGYPSFMLKLTPAIVRIMCALSGSKGWYPMSLARLCSTAIPSIMLNTFVQKFLQSRLPSKPKRKAELTAIFSTVVTYSLVKYLHRLAFLKSNKGFATSWPAILH